jgi:hypothetical protein
LTFSDGVAWAALIVAAASALFTALQWKSSERAADAAEKSAEAAEKTADSTKTFAELGARPWVLVTSISMLDGPDLLAKFNIQITVENLGATPAFDLMVNDKLNVVSKPIPDRLPLPIPDSPSRFVLGPGRQVNSGSTIHLSAQEITKIYEQDCYLLSYGLLTYKDAFQKVYETRWCCYYFGGHGFVVNDKHNSAT